MSSGSGASSELRGARRVLPRRVLERRVAASSEVAVPPQS